VNQLLRALLQVLAVKEGSSFKAGDNLAEIETEKITIEIPAQSAGKLTKILVKRGQT
jgi:pyruvate/2-oxoglutarate dehydrogenase complex dihydrolipoamide acyltransferase (E2) component